MRKIKVLHIITRLDRGGSAQNTLFTVSRLKKERFSVVLMSGETKDKDSHVSDFIAQEKINYILVPQLIREINFLKDIRVFKKIYQFIKEGKFDIVHTHSSKAGILGRWAAKMAGVKIIVHTPHGHIFYGYGFGWFKTKLFIFIEQLTGLITDRIITLTQKGKEEHISYKIGGPDKFTPIYSGIEIDKFLNFHVNVTEEKEKLRIPFDSPVIGTVSRLSPVKGNKYFAACLPQVVDKFPDLRVLMVGEGEERKELQDYIEKKGLLKNVIFMGEFKDIRSVLSILDILVLASLNEGMGRCLLEAQVLGVPVVATKVGGIPEVVKDGISGILVPPQDSKAMAGALISLLSDKRLRCKMSQEAKKWADEKFSAKVMVEKISNLYEELIKEKM